MFGRFDVLLLLDVACFAWAVVYRLGAISDLEWIISTRITLKYSDPVVMPPKQNDKS